MLAARCCTVHQPRFGQACTCAASHTSARKCYGIAVGDIRAEQQWHFAELPALQCAPARLLTDAHVCVAVQVHLILRHKSPKSGTIEEKHLSMPPSVMSDGKTHVYTGTGARSRNRRGEAAFQGIGAVAAACPGSWRSDVSTGAKAAGLHPLCMHALLQLLTSVTPPAGPPACAVVQPSCAPPTTPTLC